MNPQPPQSTRESSDGRASGIVEGGHLDCRQIEIFPARPASAAIQLARGSLHESQADLIVHDRHADGTFQPALTLTR